MTGQYHSVTLDYKTNKPIISFSFNDKEILDHLDEYTGVELDIEIKKHREKRSLDANAYFHVLVNKLSKVANLSDEETKIKMNLDYGTIARNIDGTKVGVEVPKGTDIKQFYPYAKWYGERQVGDLMFDKYLFYKPTHELDTKEMAQLIDGVVRECKQVGIETLPQEELNSLLKEWKI